MRTPLSIILVIYTMLLVLPNNALSQSTYTWNNKITFSSSVKLNVESNDENAFSAWSKALSVSIYVLGGMEGVNGLTGSLKNFVEQFNYSNIKEPADLSNGNSKILGAYTWAEKKGSNILIGLICDVNLSYYFICEITYTDGLEDIAFSLMNSINFGNTASLPQGKQVSENKPAKIDEKKPNIPSNNTKLVGNSAETIAEFLILINELRAKGCNCGEKYMPPVPPVVVNDILTKTATAHSEDMEKRNFFNHTAPAPAPYGKDVSERAKFFKYPMRAIGENIAYNYTQTPYSYFEQWRKSPGHCENMMFDKFKEIGYGVSGIYATLVLGVSSGSTQQTNSKPTSAESKSYIIPIVYGRHTCGNCSESMRRFREAGIEYVFYDVDADDSKNAEMWRLLGNAGSVTFPVIKVNDKTYPSALDKIDEIIRICKTPVVNNTEKKNNEEKAKGGGKVKVVLYGNSECLNTINCMQSLKSKNIEFTLLDVVKNDKYNDEMTEYVNRIGGGMMWYPVVVINDGEHIINQGNNHVDEIVNLVKGKLK